MPTTEATLYRFHRALTDLARTPSTARLDEVLALLAEVTRADLVHVEIAVDGPRLRRAWSRTEHPEALLAAIVQESLRRRTRATSASAVSVPVLVGLPVGFIYIERHRDDGTVSAADCEHAELVAWHLGCLALRFDHQFERRALVDEVRLLQRRRVLDSLQSHDGNLTAAARELRVARTFVYRIARQARGRP